MHLTQGDILSTQICQADVIMHALTSCKGDEISSVALADVQAAEGNKIDRKVLQSLIGEEILNFTMSDGSKKGDNIAGNLKTFTISTAIGKEYKIILKFIPDYSIDITSFIVHCRIMEVENEFYGSIAKDMRTLLSELDFEYELPFPRHYGGSHQFLALDDLRPAGYKMADKFEGLSEDQVAVVMRKLAQFHALSHAYIRDCGEKLFLDNPIRSKLLHFPWRPEGMEPHYFNETINMFTPVVEILKNQDAQLGLKLERLTPEFYDLLCEINDKTDIEYFPVLCHGDLWVNNILFKQGYNGIVEDVKLIDFQQVHRGNIFEDLVHFFMTSTTTEMRQKHLLNWLSEYYKSFSKFLSPLKCPLPVRFTLGTLIDGYYRSLRPFAVFLGATFAFHLGGAGQTDEEDDCSSDGESDVLENNVLNLKTYKTCELTPLGAHYLALNEFCRFSLLSEPRALQKFVHTMCEFDKLGVFN